MSGVRRRWRARNNVRHGKMKLLFDQNLSPQLARLVSDLYPGSIHVRNIGLREAADSEIWDYALSNGFMIVSKDSDFRARSMIDGHPPKVILITLGNCATEEVEDVLRRNHQAIDTFAADPTKSFIALG